MIHELVAFGLLQQGGKWYEVTNCNVFTDDTCQLLNFTSIAGRDAYIAVNKISVEKIETINQDATI